MTSKHVALLSCAGAALLTGAAAYIGLAMQTPSLPVAAAGALLATLLSGSMLAYAALRWWRAERSSRRALAVGFVTALLPVTFFVALHTRDALRATPGAVEAPVVRALADATHALTTLRAGSGFADLAPFGAALEGRSVVALGESTHGASEFFQLKHRLVEFLIGEMGFRHFAMEVHPEHHGVPLNVYIHGGEVDPRRLLYWPWATEEYMALLNWMRHFNAGRDPGDRITFHGIDPVFGPRDRVMADNVTRLLHDVESHGRIIVWAANSHVQGASGGMGEHLRRALGDRVYLLGLEFHSGAFTSRFRTVQTYRVGPRAHSYYSHALAQLPDAVRFADFATLARQPELKAWLNEPRYSDSLYEIYALTRLFPGASDSPTALKHRVNTPLPERFDGLMHVREVTPARRLQRPDSHASREMTTTWKR